VAALWVTIVAEWGGVAALLVAVAITTTAPPPADDLGYGALAGVAGGLGLVAFYRALAVGTMSLVAPVAALGGGLPLAWGLASGERPSPVALAGALLALAGAAAVVRAPGPASRRGLGLAGLAAAGFGLYFILIASAADESALWASTASRSAAGVLLLGVALGLRASAGAPARAVLPLAGLGVIDATAGVSYAAATQVGLLSLVGALASLYPVATAAWAFGLDGERLGRWQFAGAALAVAGVALVAAGM
jgi:drug/metabolite transporter (DMT)-like permease